MKITEEELNRLVDKRVNDIINNEIKPFIDKTIERYVIETMRFKIEPLIDRRAKDMICKLITPARRGYCDYD